MTRPVSLDRLRDISKHRSIRTPLVQNQTDRVEGIAKLPTMQFEWPVPGSSRY
jgi:hypothetical protein